MFTKRIVDVVCGRVCSSVIAVGGEGAGQDHAAPEAAEGLPHRAAGA
jgi:hypothetical protein